MKEIRFGQFIYNEVRTEYRNSYNELSPSKVLEMMNEFLMGRLVISTIHPEVAMVIPYYSIIVSQMLGTGNYVFTVVLEDVYLNITLTHDLRRHYIRVSQEADFMNNTSGIVGDLYHNWQNMAFLFNLVDRWNFSFMSDKMFKHFSSYVDETPHDIFTLIDQYAKFNQRMKMSDLKLT